MIVSVKNFGQIASASIDMSTFSIFVGHNNSGKTLMMQLIYGVIDYLTRRIDISEHYTFGELPITIDSTNFPEIEAAVNKVLREKKDEIVFSTFKRRIPIEALRVEFGEIENEYTLKELPTSEIKEKYTIGLFLNEKGIARIQRGKHVTLLFLCYILLSEGCGMLRLKKYHKIFLPASRTGIQLLSKFFFSNQFEDIDFEALDNNAEGDEDETKEENEYGLTEPMHDFLVFLQEHTHSEENTEKNAALIQFVEENLINGKLRLVNGEMWYTPDYDENLSVPPQISSSMVNEFAPLMRILSGIKRPRCIFYDEVETCLHPLKQIQMARLLVRMVNVGYKMIVSTHSDTMAAAINNLILLSASEQREQKAQALGYDENDFLKPEKLSNVHVYQFIPDKTGRTVVTELAPYFESGHGYNFDIFNASNDKIYHDAMTILEDE